MSGLITRGRPIDVVDAIGNVLAIPRKLLFLTADLDRHEVSPEVERVASAFMDRHGMDDVQVRLNEYDPVGEWRRLWGNRRVSLLWRLTLGLLCWTSYTLNCGRIFGGDHYNPFSHTVNVYSDHEAVVLHELGHALDFRKRTFPGLYALAGMVPLVPLYQEFRATWYAIQYFREVGMSEEEIRSYRMLYPAYFTYIFGAFVDYLPATVVTLVFLPFVLLGWVVGLLHSVVRMAVIRARGELGFSVASQLGDEVRGAVSLFHPGTDRGRGLLGATVGFCVGVWFGGFGGFIGAAIGFAAFKLVGARIGRDRG